MKHAYKNMQEGFFFLPNILRFKLGSSNSNDDFIITSLGKMDYSHWLYKKTIPNYKFIRGQLQIGILKNKHFTSCIVFKCPYGS
jgi:hypothetical protein